MAIIDHPDPSAAPVTERLRVITAGRVGNMEARLGTSGFDVVAVANTEDDLVHAVLAADPDAIVVEADLCESLEHIRRLAPDAVLIVVGDHTPAGALGRIERGVSGTVMAGLLHALVAEGVGAAVVWGLVPALTPPAPPAGAEHVGASLLAAKAHVVREHVETLFRDHGAAVAAAGTVVVTAAVSVLLTLGASPMRDRVERAAVVPPTEQSPAPADQTPKAPSGGDHRPASHAADARDSSPWRTGPQIAPTPAPLPSSDSGTSPSRETPPPLTSPSPEANPPPGTTPPPVTSPPPETTSPPTPPSGNDATRPPGVAKGWDHRPPKGDDNGNKTGWSSNGVPDELPPGHVDPPPPPAPHPPPEHGGVPPGKDTDAPPE
jgi:hypothetical protein